MYTPPVIFSGYTLNSFATDWQSRDIWAMAFNDSGRADPRKSLKVRIIRSLALPNKTRRIMQTEAATCPRPPCTGSYKFWTKDSDGCQPSLEPIFNRSRLRITGTPEYTRKISHIAHIMAFSGTRTV
ncbi:hypothetical protein BDZ89DRAFT_1066443 [Hymenopellis radicata]|nr:hypothetical protein BDZ89DRAFT_1066443 [Hymenopellis radicata]